MSDSVNVTVGDGSYNKGWCEQIARVFNERGNLPADFCGPVVALCSGTDADTGEAEQIVAIVAYVRGVIEAVIAISPDGIPNLVAGLEETGVSYALKQLGVEGDLATLTPEQIMEALS